MFQQGCYVNFVNAANNLEHTFFIIMIQVMQGTCIFVLHSFLATIDVHIRLNSCTAIHIWPDIVKNLFGTVVLLYE